VKPKRSFASAWLFIGAASLLTRVVSGYSRAETDQARADYLMLVGSITAGILVVAALGLFVFATVGRATLAALRDENINAIFFRSSPASATKNAVRYLQRETGQPQRFLTVYSPAVMIDDAQLTIWRGSGHPELVLAVPRSVIRSVSVTEIQDGFVRYAALQLTLAGAKGESILPLAVLREDSALRSGSPEEVSALAGRIRDYLDLGADAPAEPAS